MGPRNATCKLYLEARPAAAGLGEPASRHQRRCSAALEEPIGAWRLAHVPVSY